MRKPQKEISLDLKKVTLGQFDCSDDLSANGEFEEIEKNMERFASAIGNYLISFSALEDTVDTELATVINERGYEPGYRIIKYLSFRDKINLLRDDHASFVKHLTSGNDTKRLLAKLDVIYKKLCELSELRNKVAHANWQSLDVSGFVRTKIITNSDDASLKFLKVKLTPGVLVKFRKQNLSLMSMLVNFRESTWLAFQRQERRNATKNKGYKK